MGGGFKIDIVIQNGEIMIAFFFPKGTCYTVIN